jgi:hypothetical protein
LVFACALSLSAALPPQRSDAQAGASDADATARQAFEAGQDAYDRGRFSEALVQFERAYALSPRPKLLFNIGRAADSDLKTERAIEAYEAYLKAFPRADNREFVEARLTKLRELAGQRGREATKAPAALPPPPAPVTPQPYVSPAPTSGAPAAGIPAPYVSPKQSTPSSTADDETAPLEQSARSDKAIPGLRFYGGFRIGVGGTSTIGSPALGDRDYDLETTVGLQFGAGYAWRFFAIGGELRVSWMGEKAPEGAEGEAIDFTFVDVVVKPKAGYQLRNVPLEFYATLPIGVSVPVNEPFAAGDLTLEPGPTVGFFVGASYFFSEHLGVNAELGWLGSWHNFSVYGEETDASLSMSQFSPLLVNLMAAF